MEVDPGRTMTMRPRGRGETGTTRRGPTWKRRKMDALFCISTLASENLERDYWTARLTAHAYEVLLVYFATSNCVTPTGQSRVSNRDGSSVQTSFKSFLWICRANRESRASRLSGYHENMVLKLRIQFSHNIACL